MEVSECSERPVFIFLSKKIGFALWPDIMLSQTLLLYYIILYYIIDKKSFFDSWGQTATFNDNIAFFVG